MNAVNQRLARLWGLAGTRFLPFADAASVDLPLSRLLRLSLFQVSVGMATALLVGTLNRVMIVELGMAAWLVALMVAIPLVIAPFRAFIGFRSDSYRSALGWRRAPFIWFGTLLQYGGLAIMPFALVVLTGDDATLIVVGHTAAALAFLLVGAGLQTTQTAGLALAGDLATDETRPRVVALMYVMFLVGLVVSGFAFSLLLADFSNLRLVQVVQGAAVLTLVMNVVALWKQEARDAGRTRAVPVDFRTTWRSFVGRRRAKRFLVALALGATAFSMQDVVLEPYGAEVLGLSVSATSALTAILASGSLVAFGLAARVLSRGVSPIVVAGAGVVAGLPAFAAVIFAAPVQSTSLFVSGVAMIGFSGGLFAVGMLAAAMTLDDEGRNGLAIGAWGAVQATAAGIGVALGGVIRDGVAALGVKGTLGPAMVDAAAAYGVIYHLEIVLLFATLAAIGPLAGRSFIVAETPGEATAEPRKSFGLAEIPG